MALSESSALDEAQFSQPGALHWPLLEELPARLAQKGSRELCRELLQQAQRELAARFAEGEPVEGLVHGRCARSACHPSDNMEATQGHTSCVLE